MKLICLSDLHLLYDSPVARMDDVKGAQKEKLEYVLGFAVKDEAIVVQAGDFTHKPRGWYLLRYWLDFLCHSGDMVGIYAVRGQHDSYMYGEQNATVMGVLDEICAVTQVPNDGLDLGDIDLYGCSYGEEVPKPRKARKLKVLLIHRMIVDKPMWAGQEDYDLAIDFLKEHKGYDLIVCGDCHRKFLFRDSKRIILNTGCMTRLTAEAYNFKHKPGFYIYDTETRNARWHEIPHRSAEEVLTREHLEREEQTNEMLENFIAGIGEGQEFGMDFVSNLEKFVEENDLGIGVKRIIGELISEEN